MIAVSGLVIAIIVLLVLIVIAVLVVVAIRKRRTGRVLIASSKTNRQGGRTT